MTLSPPTLVNNELEDKLTSIRSLGRWDERPRLCVHSQQLLLHSLFILAEWILFETEWACGGIALYKKRKWKQGSWANREGTNTGFLSTSEDVAYSIDPGFCNLSFCLCHMSHYTSYRHKKRQLLNQLWYWIHKIHHVGSRVYLFIYLWRIFLILSNYIT